MSEANLKVLVSDRGYVKGTISRLSQFCTTNDISVSSVELLLAKRSSLVGAYKEYESFNKQILLLNTDDAENYDEYESKYYNSIAILDRELSKRNTVHNPVNPTPVRKEKRAIALENTDDEKLPISASKQLKSKAISGVTTFEASSCKYCKQSHRLFQCAKFKMSPVRERCDFVDKNSLCIVCLNAHGGKCRLRLKCLTCKKGHNSLLHIDSPSNAETSGHVVIANHASTNNIALTMSSTTQAQDVLLPTAVVRLINKNGAFTYAKALLDSGSQVSFVTESLIKQVNCDLHESHQLISGVVAGTNSVSQRANLTVHSMINDFSIDISCCVVKNITCDLPQQSFDITNLKIPSHVKLADKNFNKISEISLLLGCDIFFQVLQRESIPVAPSGPYLVNTSFGYVVAGSLPVSAGKVLTSNLCINIKGNDSNYLLCKELDPQLHELNNNISKFWECEKVPNVYKEGTSEHQLAEQCFLESVKLQNKRFSVALPLKLELENVQLGDSLSYALQRFYNLEKRLSRDEILNQQYRLFIKKYLEQGHAKYVDINDYNLNAGNVYFLPHHPVINPNSNTTPVRAVFDASMKTNNGLCLNDIMLNGPVVQSELFDILTLFRTYKYVLLCDVKAMYRQVFVDNKYCCLQNILWRDTRHDSVKCIQLQTVTYGLKSSAFLATRCLRELAQRYADKYPLASFALQHSTYVDDVQCGSNNMSEIQAIKKELILLMGEGSFSLHKWCSNHNEVLQDISSDLRYFGNINFNKNSMCMKTFGLIYDVASDTLNMQCPVAELSEKYTKRQMLSFISKFFDPLGLIGPILVQAKYIMQQIWYTNLKWDDVLPEELNKQAVDFANSLVQMSCISIPRNINVQSSNLVELVGYADASNIAHGCCLYLRVIDSDNIVKVNLLCSKSRINPKNKQLTTPKLELNSALLLAMLAKRVYDTLSHKYHVKTYLYSDSQIVLAWLGMEPVKLNVYVANRVAKIQKLCVGFQWAYVNTADNPADCLSRGMSPKLLETEVGQLWFHGPKYLRNIEFEHLNSKHVVSIANIPELKPISQTCCTTACSDSNLLYNFIDKYSNIEKLTKIMSYVQRFIYNCKHKNVNDRTKGAISPGEMESALHCIIRLDQARRFEDDIKALKEQKCLKSNLNSLNPFIDSSGLLRVGGRLQNAGLSFSQRHPIILAKKSNISRLIILNEHLRLKHAGQKLLLSCLNERYWLINAIREVKSVVHKCIICFKLKAKTATQIMGSLPRDRVSVTRPFQIVGTDYGGPFYVKQTRIRKPVITKAYIVIFVCFVTKAIHIELASDMTTNTFLACLKRFIARRNKPTKIYCDNASYYKGARNVLDDLYNLFNSTEHQSEVLNYCCLERINFHFIPSYSPVFAGLSEAGIKSVKYHIKRVVGNTVLTYEELYTVLVQIESILNSRPLTPMSIDQDDMTYLSPGHFLTGAPLMSYPELNLVGENIGKLSFWKLCVQMQQSFWKQWHKQYLVMLQNRPKWRGVEPNLQKGALVILRDKNVSPLNWPMGRIVDVMPGRDGKVRALDVKTSKGSIIRTSIMKVCPLPLEIESN